MGLLLQILGFILGLIALGGSIKSLVDGTSNSVYVFVLIIAGSLITCGRKMYKKNNS